MNYLRFSKAGLFAFFLLFFAAPAFAQFEVSPDHFDDQPPAKAKANAASRKKAGTYLASSHRSAGKVGAAKQKKIASGSLAGKPHPGTRSAGTLTAAQKRSSATRRSASKSVPAAPSLKAQASNVRRE